MSQWLPFRRDLGVQLLALYLLFVGLVIAAALIFDALAGSRLEHDVKAADLALARSIALETNASLHNAQNTVAELSLAPEVQSGEVDRLPPLFAAVATARSEVNLVYLLDEVLAGLNPAEITEMVQTIRAIRDQGITIFMIEHVMHALMNVSDRVIVLDYGEQIAEGTPEEVASDPKVIEAYLGDPKLAEQLLGS